MVESCQSKEVQRFLLKIGMKIDACNEYGETPLHYISGIKWNSLIFKDYMNLISLGWNLEKKDESGNTPIDLAIDYRNWRALNIFIQGDLSHSCIVHAIGELLAQYWHIGSKTHDKFIFSLINKAKLLNKEDCEYLLRRACNGAAWPYLIPLLRIANSTCKNLKINFPWQILENNKLFNQITSRIVGYMDNYNNNVFLIYNHKMQVESRIIEDKYNFHKMSFITKQRKCIARGLKKQVKMENIDINLISILLNMYCSIK